MVWEREVVADRFQVERLAGAGGMGRVYRALDRRSGAPVALKVLRGSAVQQGFAGGKPGTLTLTSDGTGEAVALRVLQAPGAREVERLAREARLLSRLGHPRVVRYIAAGVTADGEPYLVMEWLEGETLSDRLKRGPLGVEETLMLGLRAAEALGAVHRLGVVHRDVKPSNLFLRGGAVEGLTLIDFGIARGLSATLVLTVPGALLGTVGYVAPEQARGASDVDARADVFSLGCVMYRCLAGRVPVAEGDPISGLFNAMTEEPPRLRSLRAEVPAALDALVGRMLARSPSARPKHGGEVAAELRQIAREMAAAAGGAAAGGWMAGGWMPGGVWRAPERLSAAEQRVVALVLARSSPEAEAREGGAREALARAGRAAAERQRGRFEALGEGEIAVVLTGAGAATDLAARAARAALALQGVRGAEVAAVAGRAVVAGKGLPAGALQARAAALLGGEGAARVDEEMVGLLGGRFEVEGTPGGGVLRRERAPLDRVRLLLGKVTSCVGRERELAQLEGLFGRCVEESESGVVLVTAEAGAGKSRVAQELVRRLRARGAEVEVWVGCGDPARAGGAFGLLGDVLRRAAGITGSDTGEERRRKVDALLGRHLAAGPIAPEAIVAALGELFGLPPKVEGVELGHTVFRDPARLREQMRSAWVHLLRAECQARPLLLVLEDLQWGDAQTLRLVDAALGELSDLPLVVLGLGRAGAGGVDEGFPKLWERRRLTRVRLEPLSRKASEKLARQVLGGGTREEVLSAVVERGGGNAFLLEELIRDAGADGDEDGGEGGGEGSARAARAVPGIPETVLLMVQSRLEGLGNGARRILEAASLFGQSFWREGVEALLDGIDASSGLTELEERDLVTPLLEEARAPGRAQYRFHDLLIWEAAHAMLTEEDQALGHKLAAIWLEQSGTHDPARRSERSGVP
ncbi:serine/threonine-protein kinase [Chondromyces apiculatus]|uniref:Protein kinase domain-containing protein n=1 Tax=Chondromyces apiculatus DSM 436 TaxID=1192034 RepID=A0A017SY97_9BACT|nr:serine/threonine-protein kinase [Chondromyces apiculatus]EYF01959.1 Hypothetical protein CAP_7577 [Chondromyces apiculatus DSM 436]